MLILLLVLSLRAFPQEVSVRADQRPLNDVLADLTAGYGIQVTFDDQYLAQFKVTLDDTFPSADEAIEALLRGLPLDYEKNAGVFVIFPVSGKQKSKETVLTGMVMDRYSREPLPYAHVIVNQRGMTTDLKGSFAFPAFDTVFSIRVSHLGYYIMDTVVTAPADLTFSLTPSMIGLTEVEITNTEVSRSDLAGREAGTMKLNHIVAGFLPGFGDNSVFNLLRLQPGILASGEQTNDLIIWGCYEGQSKTVFDGFTLYSLKNFNDNISAFNPLIAKDIEVYKGGYDARFGDRVGGIVNVTGINGNMVKPAFTLNVNNMTLNGMLEVPVTRNSSLVAAFRTTYYELYNPSDVNTRLWRNNDPDTANDADYEIVPDYRFMDANLKYTLRINGQDLFYISLYGGNDRFSYKIDEPLQNVVLTKETREGNTQAGGAVFYGKSWNNGSSTNFSLNYSGLKSSYSDDLSVEGKASTILRRIRDESSVNTIREYTAQADHRQRAGKRHLLEGGLIVKINDIFLQEDTFGIAQAHLDDRASRLVLYFQDHFSPGDRFELKAGLRLNRSFNLDKFFAEPRLGISFRPAPGWRLNAAWGIYDQFISESSVVDELGNFRYVWAVCDEENVPVLRAMHFVAGVAYEQSALTISMESYYKTTTGLTRFVRNNYYHSEGIYEGKGRSYGIDFLIKKEYRGHTAWVSYTLSRTEELFEYFLKDEYRRAPQDQRHEVKAALLLNFDPLYFSADYVYGSGFPAPAYLALQQNEDLTYSRLDVAVIYKFLDRKLKGEIGLSVLNVLNTENIKYENFERVPASQTNSISLYAEAIPITPALYLKLAY